MDLQFFKILLSLLDADSLSFHDIILCKTIFLIKNDLLMPALTKMIVELEIEYVLLLIASSDAIIFLFRSRRYYFFEIAKALELT